MKRSVPVLSKIKEFLKNHYLIVTLFFSSTIVVLWTLLRFWTERSIFDLVGQQVVAREFLENGFMDATLGATHYIVKIFFCLCTF